MRKLKRFLFAAVAAYAVWEFRRLLRKGDVDAARKIGVHIDNHQDSILALPRVGRWYLSVLQEFVCRSDQEEESSNAA